VSDSIVSKIISEASKYGALVGSPDFIVVTEKVQKRINAELAGLIGQGGIENAQPGSLKVSKIRGMQIMVYHGTDEEWFGMGRRIK